MRVGTKELYKIGLETLQHYEQEEYFGLFSYRKLLRPFLEAHYCIDEHIERFNNQSYRISNIENTRTGREGRSIKSPSNK